MKSILIASALAAFAPNAEIPSTETAYRSGALTGGGAPASDDDSEGPAYPNRPRASATDLHKNPGSSQFTTVTAAPVTQTGAIAVYGHFADGTRLLLSSEPSAPVSHIHCAYEHMTTSASPSLHFKSPGPASYAATPAAPMPRPTTDRRSLTVRKF